MLHPQTNPYLLRARGDTSPPSLAPFACLVFPCGLGTCMEPTRNVEERGRLPPCPAASIHYGGGGQPYIADIRCPWMEEVG